MNDERCVRDRVTAILTLAEAAVEGPWFFNSYSAVMSEPRLAANNAWDEATADDYRSWEEDDPRWKTEPRYIMAKTENITWNATDDKPHGDLGTADGIANGYFIAASRSETPWLARRLLEALDAIDKARDLHYDDNGDCHECDLPAPCLTVRLLALNGGNE